MTVYQRVGSEDTWNRRSSSHSPALRCLASEHHPRNAARRGVKLPRCEGICMKHFGHGRSIYKVLLVAEDYYSKMMELCWIKAQSTGPIARRFDVFWFC